MKWLLRLLGLDADNTEEAVVVVVEEDAIVAEEEVGVVPEYTGEMLLDVLDYLYDETAPRRDWSVSNFYKFYVKDLLCKFSMTPGQLNAVLLELWDKGDIQEYDHDSFSEGMNPIVRFEYYSKKPQRYSNNTYIEGKGLYVEGIYLNGCAKNLYEMFTNTPKRFTLEYEESEEGYKSSHRILDTVTGITFGCGYYSFQLKHKVEAKDFHVLQGVVGDYYRDRAERLAKLEHKRSTRSIDKMYCTCDETLEKKV